MIDVCNVPTRSNIKNCDSVISFLNASVPNKGGVANFANLATKMVTTATSLEQLQNE